MDQKYSNNRIFEYIRHTLVRTYPLPRHPCKIFLLRLATHLGQGSHPRYWWPGQMFWCLWKKSKLFRNWLVSQIPLESKIFPICFINMYFLPGWTLWTSALTVRWIPHSVMCLFFGKRSAGYNFNSYLSRRPYTHRKRILKKPDPGLKFGSLQAMFLAFLY